MCDISQEVDRQLAEMWQDLRPNDEQVNLEQSESNKGGRVTGVIPDPALELMEVLRN